MTDTPTDSLVTVALRARANDAHHVYYTNLTANAALDDVAASLIESQAIEIGQRDDLLIRAEKLRFGPDLTVESRGRSLWAVCCPGEVLNAAGLWEWEPQPSSRTDDFIARTRFTFAEAVTKARALNPNNPSL